MSGRIALVRVRIFVYALAFLAAFQFSAGVPSLFGPLHSHNRHANPSDALSEWVSVRPILSESLDQKGIDYWGFYSKQVLMINGTTEDAMTIAFYPELGKAASDYDIHFLSNDTEIVDNNTDISSSIADGGSQLNVTAVIDFNKFPGKVQITIEARRVSDGSLFDYLAVDYLAAGMAVYVSDSRTLISGAGRSFKVPSYEDIYKQAHWEFEVFVQYLNGSDSMEILKNPNPLHPFTLSDIRATFISNTGQILWDSHSCSIADGDWDGAELILRPGCGIGFGVGYVNDTLYDGFHFGIDFENNRAGRFDTFFEWDKFTLGTDFEDEEYTTYILTEISGQPPSVIRRIEPSNPFEKTGGEELYVEMINTADVNVTSFDVNDVQFGLVPGSRKVILGPDDFYETAIFLTEPGTGKRLPWTVSGIRKSEGASGVEVNEAVTFIDETGFLFSYDDDDIWVSRITPSLVSESGGETGVLSGNFSSFDASNSRHNVLIGNVPLERMHLNSSTPGRIAFSIPPRVEIGSGWEYDVIVQMGNSYSLPVRLEYKPSTLTVVQQVFGASSDPDAGVFTVSSCGSSTFMASLQDYNGNEARYSWKLLNSSNDDLFRLDNASTLVKNQSSLELPNRYIPQFDTLFKIVADIAVGNISTSSLYLVRRTESIVIGVSLIQPENRTISSPQVNMRVVAKIEVPNCYEEVASLSYEWAYENKSQTLLDAERLGIFPLSVHDSTLEPNFDKYVFPHEGDAANNDKLITTTRLGRELYVNRRYLSHGLHRIRLTVKSSNDSRLIGSAGTFFSISETPLSAVIGTGQISRRASDAEDLYISGQGSLDPDIISGANPSNGLIYEWGCTFSLFANMSAEEHCDDSLLPPKASNSSFFLVTAESLQKHSNFSVEDDEGQVYLRYSLIVRKNGREGTASQVIAVVKSSGRRLASYERIEIVNSRGEGINTHAVEFWEDIIIRPITSSTTEWRFRLEEPLSEKSQFFAGDAKIIARPGYYTSTGSSAPGFQRLPLGIKADKLSPHQQYLFSISLQEPGKVTEEVVICLNTLEVPNLIFPKIPNSMGTVDTSFRASAATTFHGNSSYTFQFYLIEPETRVREYCVDGCTGANIVRFQVAKPGEYVLQCRLLSANGKTLLAVRNNSAVISIQSSAKISQVEQFDMDMDKDFKFGDDGSVNQKAFFVTESMHEQDGQVVSMADDSSSEMCTNYTRKWAKMSRTIIGNELPNTANARNYVSLASNFARLKCVEESETLYELVEIVDQSISRTPPEETLTTTPYSVNEDLPKVALEEDLLRFYNFTMTRAISNLAAGSSRGRIVPVTGEVNNLVLDLSELWMKHITASATSGRVCGWDATYTSSSIDGEPDQSLAPSRSDPPLGVNTIRVAVMCNKEQGNSLNTPFASFHWCDSVYEMSGSERKLITVAESFDYPFLSGVQGLNKSDSRRLVMVDITTLGKSNTLVSAMSDGMVLAQAEDDGEREDTDTCYRIGLTMGEEAMTRSDECSENVAYHMWPRKTYGRQILKPFKGGAYQRRTIGVKVSPETRNDSASVIAQSNVLGLYGAYRTTCSSGLLGSGNTLEGSGLTLGGILLGILLTVLLITALTYALVSALLAAAAGRDEESALLENYVERDFFGRGQVRLNFAQDDNASVSSSEAGSDDASLQALSDLQDLDEALEANDSEVPDHASLLAATKPDLPERAPS